MKNLLNHFASVLIVLFFIIIATATAPAPWWEKDECPEAEAVDVQYQVNVKVIDRVTGEPIPNILVYFFIYDYDAQVKANADFRREICRLYYNHNSEITATSNANGVAVRQTPTFTHDCPKDQTRVTVDIVDVESRYSFAPQSITKFYNDASSFDFTIKVLDKTLL